MNNHWGTNYRAYQEGPTQFRFVLRPHAKRDLAQATRFATGFGFPLVAVAADSGPWSNRPLLEVSDPAVLVAALKPADSGKATIIRLFNAADGDKSVSLVWGDRQPKAVTLSDLGEDRGAPVTGQLVIPALGLATLRVEWQ
jgi:alpha-mannosidase